MSVTDLEQARFVRDWSGLVHKWARRAVLGAGGSAADVDDVSQAAFAEAWAAFVEWRELPDDERTDTLAKMIIATAVRDAARTHWCELRGVPRDSRQRGGGYHATILRSTLAELGSVKGGYAEQRLEAHGRHMAAYQLLMVGLVHGHGGLVSPETRLLRQEVKERLSFALHKLPPRQYALITGFYFEGRSFKEVGLELGMTCRSEIWREHRAALSVLHDEMIAFASALSARNTGHTLDEDAPHLDPY